MAQVLPRENYQPAGAKMEIDANPHVGASLLAIAAFE
jgi:hypothetical protein